MKKELVFITSRFPYPLDKGDKLRAYHQIVGLHEFAKIHLISLSESQPSALDLEALAPYCESIHNFQLSKTKRFWRLVRGIFSKRPFSLSYFYNSTVQKKIDLLLTQIAPEIVHCHLLRSAQYLSLSSKAIRSLDYMDCFSSGALKEMKASKSIFKRQFLRIEYKRLLKAEREYFDCFDQHCIISKSDREVLPLKEHSKVRVLPNGVDFATFYPQETTKEYDLLFSGNMRYIPNIYAANYAVSDILPVLPKLRSLLIAGIGATGQISKLKSQQVRIQQQFPHIREAFWKSRILLAPMNISIGLQNKIVQAMAMRIPVVCSDQANASIQAPVGTAILTATEPFEFVKAIERLLTDEIFYNQIADEGLVFVRKNFDWKTINTQFAQSISLFEE